ncbi:LOW QUALITY PROTEIN: hypothetical protein CKAN_01533800 [Cinnamomum micranthum f. kanehirae]|uniref:Uncharacterized protein n=1 Tax=Cinnamomum micranthum f. kanehirae TaxID=337451 RepID=A0A443P6N8_9MAGN|nr:LOW QUALITY PROTEIN: hypothetical protein CKAN_01533800 [Cinnamomum micranthum f. kanehirae]
MEKARELRKNHRAKMARKVVEKYNSDSNYRFPHDKISDFFAESLKSDFTKIGLAAKWCPSLNSSFDRSTLLCETIAKKVFPRESDPSYYEIKEAHYSYRIRDRLRREILVPLHKSLNLTEMSFNRWGELPYEDVASVATKPYEKLFEKHDRNRFTMFHFRVWRQKAILSTEALLPHELLSFQYDDELYVDLDIDKVTEFQWKRMVKDLSKKGKLSNCLSVCDVSESMYGKPWTGKPWTLERVPATPKRVSIALGLLTSELSEESWRRNVITFSKDQQLHRIQGKTLWEKVKSIDDTCLGHNIDFLKVFDQILDVALAAKLEEEEMVKRVFVFIDKEFYKA